ncbi:FAD dependent oxidoreductase family protein, partial [Vibrio parahaemolyticus EKP-028]
RILRLLG